MTTGPNNSIRLCEPTLEPWRGDASKGRHAGVLMSGGVDSSVAAMLLKKQGWDVIGLTMKVPMAGEYAHKRACCGTEAVYVCRDLAIPHYFVDVRDAFEKLIIEPFRRAYEEGRTPSPCVDCNTILKFRLVWDMVEREFGMRQIATGHYARVLREDGRVYLAQAVEEARDQSYFLYGIAAHRLGDLLLPLGELTKEEVRRLARAARLPVARRPDSMELCFAAEGNYRSALGLPGRKGPIVDADGNVLGEHDGIAGFTVGQRRGLGIPLGERTYVTEIDPRTNAVRIGTYAQACRRTVCADRLNVLIPEALNCGAVLWGKIRSSGTPMRCTVSSLSGDSIQVEFDEPQFAPAPGQRLVLYDDRRCVVCGGTITNNK